MKTIRSARQLFRLERLRATGADYAPASDPTMQGLAAAGLAVHHQGPTPHLRPKADTINPDLKELRPLTRAQCQTLRRMQCGSAEPAERGSNNRTMVALRRHGLVERTRTAAGWRWRLTSKGRDYAE